MTVDIDREPYEEFNRGAERALSDLYGVGPEKAMGYRPISSIIGEGYYPELIEEELRERGLSTYQAPSGGVDQDRGGFLDVEQSLFVFDRVALKKLLQANSKVLKEAGWPTEPDAFVAKVHSHAAEKGTSLYNVIADAFGDYDNPRRKEEVGFFKKILSFLR